jgi:parallel beta-helix repeat protein
MPTLLLAVLLLLAGPRGAGAADAPPGQSPPPHPNAPAPAKTAAESPPGSAAAGESISADTVWSGRRRVETIVEVLPGATLTIRPGTEVRFGPRGGLVVGGVLRAEGTAELPVAFLPLEEGQAPWSGIALRSSSTPSSLRFCRVVRADRIDVSAGEHRIERCEISGGAVGLSVTGDTAHPTVVANRITDCSEGGILVTAAAAPVIADNVLERCGPRGIGAQGRAVPEIRGNRVSGCESGIEIDQTVPRISGNVVSGCERGIALSSVSGGEPIRGNRLEGNGAGIFCQQYSTPEITGNTILKGREGVVCFRGARPLVHGNDIRDNETGILCMQFSDPEIRANTVAGNRVGIFLRYSSYAIIHGNNLDGNAVQVKIEFMSLAYERLSPDKPMRGLRQRNMAQAERGLAKQSDSKDEGFTPAGRSLDLSGNWWGEATTREMEEKGPQANISSIVDGYDERPEFDYPQEKIVYAPWARERIAAAGVQAPAPPPAP